MKNLAVTAALYLALTGTATGQTLTSGTWGGTITPPGGNTMDVQYEVSNEGGQLSITLVFEMGSFPFTNIELANGVLGFTWNPEIELVCELEQSDDGGFDGQCLDAGGSRGFLTMTPPEG